MKRRIQGLGRSTLAPEIADGLYLVRVQGANYHWHKHKPFYELNFYVLQPEAMVGGAINARLCCSSKALWKFAWFLRDFRYDQELLEQDEIDLRALIGLQGVIQVAHEVINGRSEIVLRAFAAAADWEHLRATSANSEVA